MLNTMVLWILWSLKAPQKMNEHDPTISPWAVDVATWQAVFP